MRACLPIACLREAEAASLRRRQAAALAAFSFVPLAVASPAVCDWRDTLHERLRRSNYLAANHGERRDAAGIDGQGLLVEVFVADGRSWSILLTRPNGTSCLVAAGQGWTSFTLAVGQET